MVQAGPDDIPDFAMHCSNVLDTCGQKEGAPPLRRPSITAMRSNRPGNEHPSDTGPGGRGRRGRRGAPGFPRHRGCAAPATILDGERSGEPFGLRLLGRTAPAPVRVDGELDAAMAELFLHPGDLASALQREPRERVPERVEVAVAAALADAGDAARMSAGYKTCR